MKSHATPRFWAAYRRLPADIQEHARRAYRLFRENPRHPSLRFKRVSDREPIYSVRVTLNFRAVALLEGEQVTWIWMEITKTTSAYSTNGRRSTPKTLAFSRGAGDRSCEVFAKSLAPQPSGLRSFRLA